MSVHYFILSLFKDGTRFLEKYIDTLWPPEENKSVKITDWIKLNCFTPNECSLFPNGKDYCGPGHLKVSASCEHTIMELHRWFNVAPIIHFTSVPQAHTRSLNQISIITYWEFFRLLFNTGKNHQNTLLTNSTHSIVTDL